MNSRRHNEELEVQKSPFSSIASSCVDKLANIVSMSSITSAVKPEVDAEEEEDRATTAGDCTQSSFAMLTNKK